MTEIIINDENSIDKLNDGNNDQPNIPNIVVVQPTTSLLGRQDSVVIPSISNSSISSAIQFENNNNNNNNNTLLPVCTSNSLGKNSS
jgi:hypothetical protein